MEALKKQASIAAQEFQLSEQARKENRRRAREQRIRDEQRRKMLEEISTHIIKRGEVKSSNDLVDLGSAVKSLQAPGGALQQIQFVV